VSSARHPLAVQHCEIAGPALARMLEFKTFKYPLTSLALSMLPAPGNVQRDDSGHAQLLHVAPGRFLARASASDWVRELAALQAAGVGALFDVEGKWHEFALMGTDVHRVLSCTIDLSEVLANRQCAALQLFDCPAVLALHGNLYEVWVEASYAVAFRERIGSQVGLSGS